MPIVPGRVDVFSARLPPDTPDVADALHDELKRSGQWVLA